MASLSHIKREDIERAAAARKATSREAFLEKVGANPASGYVWEWDGFVYEDPKALIAHAGGLMVDQFSGGRATLDPVFKRCGFPIQTKRKAKTKKAPKKALAASQVISILTLAA